MNTEAKIIIAFLFKRSGKSELKESELYLPLSMELGWFSTKEAQAFVTYAVTQELLIKKDGMLHPNFPLEKIVIPIGFIPLKKTFTSKKEEHKEENILKLITLLIGEKTNRDLKEVLAEIKGVEQEKHILLEVAALFVAKKYDLAIDEWTDQIEKRPFRENTE
jgi:hypothetical protein